MMLTTKPTMKWRQGRWYCTDCGGQMRLTGPAPATWRHYTPRQDWGNPMAQEPEQLTLWGERDRPPCTDDVCPCKTAGPDINGAGGRSR